MCRRTDLVLWGLAAALAWMSVAGCATAPDTWRVDPERVSETACGSWARVKLEDGSLIEGELMAVDTSVIYIHDGDALHSLPVGRISQTRTIYAKSYDGAIGAWTAAGTASTITHGLTLVFSAPLWIVTGLSSMGAERGTGREIGGVPSRKRARFPQGLPPSFRQRTEQLDPSRADSTRAPKMAGQCPPAKKDEE